MKKLLATMLLLSITLWASTTTFKGEEVTLNSKGLSVGMEAPTFRAVGRDFHEVIVGGASPKVQVIAFLPSFDTDICKLETIAFNEKVSKLKSVKVTIVSKDLPFSIDKFCHDNKITNVTTVSDYKDSNVALRYGATISAPVFLESFFARVVYIVDKDGKIAYHEIVKKIENEPNYDEIMHVLSKLTK